MHIEIAEYPSDSLDLAVLFTVSAKKIIAAIYEKTNIDGGVKLDAHAALQKLRNGFAPPIITHRGCVFTNPRVVTHDPEGVIGLDEVVDYSVLDLYSDGMVWEPRLAQTKMTKVIYSARVRQLQRRRLLASLYVRFATGDLSETIVHLVNQGGCLVTDLNADTRFDGTAIPVGPGGARWLEHFWHVDVHEAGRNDNGTIVFDLMLKNNRDNSPCERTTRLELSSDAGYLPRRLITTDDRGCAKFTLMPLGLASGDRVKVKVSATHFTNLGSTTVEVRQ